MAITNLRMTLQQCNFKSLLLADFGNSITVQKLFRQKNKSTKSKKLFRCLVSAVLGGNGLLD